MVYVNCKYGTAAPILLPEDIVTPINLLISCREEVGISRENPFLFAVPTRNSKNCLYRYRCFSTVLKRVEGLSNPENIKSTKLRKYVATVTQVTSLNGNELEWLCRSIGHSVEVQQQYYRLQDSAVELSKVSKLLITIDSLR